MKNAITITIAVATLTLGACKAADDAAGQKDSRTPNEQAESEPADEQADGGTEAEAAEADEADDAPEPLGREGSQTLVDASLEKLENSELADTWSNATDAGKDPLIGWSVFRSEGPDSLGYTADAIKSAIETATVNDFPVLVVDLHGMARQKGIDLRSISAETEPELLVEIGKTLNIDYVGTGVLTRQQDGTHELRILIVDVKATDVAHDATVSVSK